jgi:hypothetical protein
LARPDCPNQNQMSLECCVKMRANVVKRAGLARIETATVALAEHGRRRTAPMSEPALVFEDRITLGQWRVDWFDDDGRRELEIFSGPDARRQALRYAMQKYGHFREVELEPHPG